MPPLYGNCFLHDKEHLLVFWRNWALRGTDWDNCHTHWISPLNARDKALYGHPTIKPIEFVANIIRAYACEPVCSVERPERFALLPRGRYATLAFPVKSGNEGPECFFKGWAVFSVEIVSITEKSATFLLLSPLRLDDPAGAKKRIMRKELDEKKRLKDPLFFFLSYDDLKPLRL